MPLAGSPRYEIKISVKSHQLPQVNAWVRLHPAHWRVAFPSRQVNNVYFETFDYKSLNDNLAGVGERRKLRLRWYGPTLETISGAQLELKCRQGQVGWKETWTLEGMSLDLHQPWSDLLRAIKDAADAQASLWLDQFACPALLNHYQRDYYVTTDQAVRLTVDSRLRAYDQRFTAQPNYRRPAPRADRVVVELKTERQHHQRLVHILAHFPIRADRHSKYVQGMIAAPDFDGIELL